MRVHDKPLAEDESEMLYVQDVPGMQREPGVPVVLVSCSKCERLTTRDDKCPGCNRWFVYRPWCEW